MRDTRRRQTALRDTRRRRTALRVTRRREAFVQGKTTTASFDRIPYPVWNFSTLSRYIAMNHESNSTQFWRRWVESKLSHVSKFGIWSESASRGISQSGSPKNRSRAKPCPLNVSLTVQFLLIWSETGHAGFQQWRHRSVTWHDSELTWVSNGRRTLQDLGS